MANLKGNKGALIQCAFLRGCGFFFLLVIFLRCHNSFTPLPHPNIQTMCKAQLYIMAKPFAKPFYKSKAWEQARSMALSRDNHLCQDCLKSGIITQAEEVHHIIELTPENINDPSINTDLNNLVCLCHACHTRRHLTKEKRFSIDANGKLIF